MTILGLILLGIGAILFLVQRSKAARVFLIKSARPAEAAALQKMAGDIAAEIGAGNWRDYVRIRGTIRADQPLVSELTQRHCVHYSMKVRREYEETVTTRRQGRTSTQTRRGSEIVADSDRSVPFFLEDATGRIAVDPHGASMETVEVLDEFKPEQTAGTQLVFGSFRVNLPAPMGGGRRTLGYRYTESVLPVDSPVLVVGAVSDSTGEVRLCQSDDGKKKLIISTKAYDALAAGAERTARITRIVMLVFLVSGVASVLIGIAS